MTRATSTLPIETDEVSLVLAGAVTGTEMLSVRFRVGAARNRALGDCGARRPQGQRSVLWP